MTELDRLRVENAELRRTIAALECALRSASQGAVGAGIPWSGKAGASG